MEQEFQIDYQLYLEEREMAQKYPNYCEICLGWGALYGLEGEKTGNCPDCVGQGNCPRCATALTGHSCPSCDWQQSFFVTVLPIDQYGNRSFMEAQPVVVEVVEGREAGYPVYTVIAPEPFKLRCPYFSSRGYNTWIEVEGPARTLTEYEYVELLEKAGVEERYITWAKHRLI